VPREWKVAVVDDDKSFREALVELLYTFGYDAHGFASAEEFVGGNAESLFECVITDIHMPGMSGFDLKGLLSSNGCKVPVIMITARPETKLESRAAASGAVCLLRKPFQPEALVGCLEKALTL
jgi:FixJ family two-component response regulator